MPQLFKHHSKMPIKQQASLLQTRVDTNCPWAQLKTKASQAVSGTKLSNIIRWRTSSIVVSRRSSMKRVFPTARSCSVWSSSSGASNSALRCTSRPKSRPNRQRRPSRAFLCKQLCLLPHRMSPTCPSLPSQISHKNRQRRGLRPARMLRWQPMCMPKGAKISPSQLRKVA